MTKTELETMLQKQMEQNAALVALVTEQQQEIQKLRARQHAEEAEELTLPLPRRERAPEEKTDKLKERLLNSLQRLPKEGIDDMPNVEDWLDRHPMEQLNMLTEGLFLVLTERHVGEEAVKAYVEKRLTPMVYRRLLRYLETLAENEQLPFTDEDDEAGRLKLEALRAEQAQQKVPALPPTAGAFVLPGAEKLASFFNTHVVDIVNRFEQYSAMGISFPRPFILEGPPGCGKTYAVERLAEHLNWKTYRITSGTIGSTYVHGTAKKTEEIFEEAKKNAPALIIIDEMDAFMPNREEVTSGNKHHVEEVDCFLKCLQTAAENKVLVVGMTNLISSIDPAVLRTGRMGTHITVGMPDRESVEAVLRGAVEKRPHEENLPFVALAEQLLDRPLSDVTYVAEEAAMQAVRADHPRITQADLESALLRLQEHTAPKEERRALGFCA